MQERVSLWEKIGNWIRKGSIGAFLKGKMMDRDSEPDQFEFLLGNWADGCKENVERYETKVTRFRCILCVSVCARESRLARR